MTFQHKPSRRLALGLAALAAALGGASAAFAAETITYTYDVHGQVTGVSRSTGTSSTYVYDLAANRSSVANASGARAAPAKSSPATTRPTWSDFREESGAAAAPSAPTVSKASSESPVGK